MMAWGVARERLSVIRIQLLGILDHRDVALRAVSAACKLVAPAPHESAWHEFHAQVVSAVGEAFNNVVLHGYQGRTDGPLDLRIHTGPGRIRIDMRDWGPSFDPKSVPIPALDALPESGLGFFIMQSFMELAYRPGRPNLLTLSKELSEHPTTAARRAEGST
jgi:anti-sigma regulatory factor (Ser/Thr protein kinase)